MISALRAQELFLKIWSWRACPICLSAGETPEKLASSWPEGFDKILVDAPCSGEGMFRRDSRMALYWAQAGPDSYTEVQRKLLEAAYRMLRPGGEMVYSTCTFSVCENEQQILKLLDAHRDLSTEPAVPHYGGFEPGLLGLSDAVRIYPHKMDGEGHFLVRLRKAGAVESESLQAERRRALRCPQGSGGVLGNMSKKISAAAVF